MDCCSSHMSPHLVVKGLRALDLLNRAVVRVQVLFNNDSLISNIEHRLIGLP